MGEKKKRLCQYLAVPTCVILLCGFFVSTIFYSCISVKYKENLVPCALMLFGRNSGVFVDKNAIFLTWCCLSLQESEEFLSNLVVNKTIFAKVDRLAGIINFQRPKDPNNILNDWSHKLNSLMALVNKTTHLIAKEEMIHNLQ